MAAKLSSAGGAMRASLVLVLLLAAVASAHGREVECENQMDKPVTMNGVVIDAKAKAVIQVAIDAIVTLIIKGADGHDYSKTFVCPPDVVGLVVLYVNLYVTVKVKAVVSILGLVATLLGKILFTLKLVL